MIFRGSGSSGRHARKDQSGRSGRPASIPSETPDDETQPTGPQRGPYDISEAPTRVERLDLGSLQIPAIPGVEVRVQANPDGSIQQVVLVHGDNALQLGVFAAPRSEGIWDEVREEIRQSLFGEGVAAQEAAGEYGTELRAQVRTPEGPTDLRFVGVDGPRWMVRGVYQGAAAADPASAGPLAEVMDGLVVNRGQEAKPVREPLPLRLPREVAERAEASSAGATSWPSPAAQGGARVQHGAGS